VDGRGLGQVGHLLDPAKKVFVLGEGRRGGIAGRGEYSGIGCFSHVRSGLDLLKTARGNGSSSALIVTPDDPAGHIGIGRASLDESVGAGFVPARILWGSVEDSMPEEEEDNRPVTVSLLTKIFDARIPPMEAKFEAALDSRIPTLRNEMIERIEDTETRLLKEFRKWAVRIEAVGRVNETRSIGLDQRIAVIEERLNDLEDRP